MIFIETLSGKFLNIEEISTIYVLDNDELDHLVIADTKKNEFYTIVQVINDDMKEVRDVLYGIVALISECSLNPYFDSVLTQESIKDYLIANRKREKQS